MDKTKLNKQRNVLCTAAGKVAGCALSTAYMIYNSCLVAFAGEFTPATIGSIASPTSAMGNLVGIILKLFTLIGAALGVWGVGMFALAVKNEEPESKQKAIMCILAGIVLMALRTIAQALKLIG